MRCTNCHAELGAGESFCPQCGTAVQDSNKKFGAIWLWGAGLGLLLAAVVALGMYAFELYSRPASSKTVAARPATAREDPPPVADREEVEPRPAPPPAHSPPPEPAPAAPAPARRAATRPQPPPPPAREAPAAPRPKPKKPVPAPPPVPPPNADPPNVDPPPTPAPAPAPAPAEPSSKSPEPEPLIPQRVVDGGAPDAEPPEPRARGRILQPDSGGGARTAAPTRGGPSPAPPATSGSAGSQAQPASVRQPGPPPRPLSGDLFWTGKLDKNAIVLVESGQANQGYLDGAALPGRPVELTTASAGVEIVEAPGPANGWTRFSFRCLRSTKTSATVNFRWRTK